MVGHTPGPWRVGYLDKNSQSVVMGNHIEICTCWHHSVGSIEQEMHKNAALIAEAPALLESLKALAKLLGSMPAQRGSVGLVITELLEANCVIDRAEGRS